MIGFTDTCATPATNNMARFTPSELAAYEARRGTPPPELRIKPARESELHRLITQDIRRRGWLCCHGAMHKSTKRTLGEPDYHVLAPRGRHFMVECKTATGKLSEDQQHFIAQADQLGHPVYVVRSFDEYLALAKCFEKGIA